MRDWLMKVSSVDGSSTFCGFQSSLRCFPNRTGWLVSLSSTMMLGFFCSLRAFRWFEAHWNGEVSIFWALHRRLYWAWVGIFRFVFFILLIYLLKTSTALWEVSFNLLIQLSGLSSNKWEFIGVCLCFQWSPHRHHSVLVLTSHNSHAPIVFALTCRLYLLWALGFERFKSI